MLDAQLNPRIAEYDAPNTAPDCFIRRVLFIPVDDNFRVVAAVNDVLAYLTQPDVFKASEGISEIDMQALMSDMLLTYFEGIEAMIGAVVPMLTDVLPTWMLWCDGTEYNRVDYPDLYGRLNAEFRISADTFVVPDLRSKFVFGADETTYNVGDTGGSETHTLTVDELPAHHHAHDPVVVPNVDIEAPGVPDLVAAGIIPGTENTYDTGGGQSHNNMPPYMALKFAVVAKWREVC